MAAVQQCGNNPDNPAIEGRQCVPQTYAVRYPFSQCGSVVTVAGKMCILPARSVCGSKILCKRPCVRSAEKFVNGSVSRRPFVSFVNAHLCFFHKRMQLGILSRNAAVL